LELIYNKEIMLVIERNANTEEFFDQKGAYGATSIEHPSARSRAWTTPMFLATPPVIMMDEACAMPMRAAIAATREAIAL